MRSNNRYKSNCPEPKDLDDLNMQYASKMEQLDEILTWHGDVK